MKYDKKLILISEANIRIRSVGIKSFLLGLLIGAALMAMIAVMFSCTPLAEAPMTDCYFAGGVYVESDTIVGTDTAYIWRAER